ncbi:MAG: Rieske (2Fe-2S) protein [Deltaproteobacteria bacterium]|nr:Rieske (2Fe-2S) protein [Deltaproteobacteria bacterium]
MMGTKQTSTSTVARRSFLSQLWKILGILALVEFMGLVVAFLWPGKPRVRKGDFGDVLAAGAVDSYAPESVTAFQRGRFYLARLTDGGFIALSMACTHLGCTVPWVADEKRFICPCHASCFDIRGAVIQSPAARALDYFPVTIVNGIVHVDTGKPMKRSDFHISQTTQP